MRLGPARRDRGVYGVRPRTGPRGAAVHRPRGGARTPATAVRGHLRGVPRTGQPAGGGGVPGRCEVCDRPDRVIRVPAVDGAGPVDACPDHITMFVWRCHDLDWLARRRAAVDGETVEHARDALLGQRPPPTTATG